MAVQFVVSHSHISTGRAIPELDAAHAALEARDVVEQPQTLNDHGCPTACKSDC